MEKEKREEKQKEQNQEIEDFGQVTLEEGEHRIHLLNIIGEIEGHECLASSAENHQVRARDSTVGGSGGQ